MQTETTRRALIGGAGVAIAALAVTIPAHATGGTCAAKIAAFNRANDHFLRVCNHAHAVDDVSNAACNVAGQAYDAMIATPAETPADVAGKLDALMAWCEGCVIPDAEVRIIAAEARILLRGER